MLRVHDSRPKCPDSPILRDSLAGFRGRAHHLSKLLAVPFPVPSSAALLGMTKINEDISAR
jgi:hypothetical protein